MSSAWTALATLARKTQLTTFGFVAVFSTAGGGATREVQAAWLEGAPDGQPRRYGVLLVNTGDGEGSLPPSLFKSRDSVQVAGVDYRIVEIDIRKFDLSRVVLERTT